MIRSLLVALLLVALAACASLQRPTPARDPSLLSDQPAPVGRICAVVPGPPELPAADALVDSTALRTAVAELREEQEVPEGYVLLSMTYDRFGANIRRTVIEHDVSRTVADSLQKLVFALRRSHDVGDEEWGVRLRLDLGDPVRMRVGRQEFCQPRSRDIPTVSPWNLPARERGVSGEVMYETVWMRVNLDPHGMVASARVERGFVGTNLEHQLINFVRTLSFEPALADGVPVSGTLLVPVQVRRR